MPFATQTLYLPDSPPPDKRIVGPPPPGGLDVSRGRLTYNRFRPIRGLLSGFLPRRRRIRHNMPAASTDFWRDDNLPLDNSPAAP